MSEQLFTAFTSSSKKEWQQKVVEDLKGKPIEALFIELDSQLDPIDFLAHSDDISYAVEAVQNKSNNEWKICEQITVADVGIANRQALLALGQGANSIHFIIMEPVELEKLCDGIMHEYIHTTFSGEAVTMDTPIEFKAMLDRKVQDHKNVSCSFSPSELNLDLINTVANTFRNGKGIRIQSDETSIVKEISNILHQLNAVFDGLDDRSMSKENQGKCFSIECKLRDNFYTNIASLRAIHLVVSQLKEVWGLPKSVIEISAVVEPSNKDTSTKDTQKIRSTAQAMAAVIGGVSELTLLPLVTVQDSMEFENRIIRNIQHVIQLESFMNRVVDPSAGSYFIENLTEKIAEAAWNDFRQNWSAKQ